MKTIQEIGKEILVGPTQPFYIWGGTEYGIKEKYISILEERYGSKVEGSSVKEIVDMLSSRHLIPLQPAVYVIRYDESFLTEISDLLAEKIAKLHFDGVVICLYESDKSIKKLDKFLPDSVVRIDSVSSQFVAKYLHSDFPKLSDKFINLAAKHGDNYNQAKNMCGCMNSIDNDRLSSMQDEEIASLFGCSTVSTESQIRLGVASRQFNYLLNVIELYADDSDRILYAILQTMMELDKLMDNKHASSDIRKYVSLWTREDIYHMFMHTYHELKRRRSSVSVDMEFSLIYLFGLLKFKNIPSLEAMKS